MSKISIVALRETRHVPATVRHPKHSWVEGRRVLQTLLLVAKKRVAFAEVSPLRKMIEGDAVVLKAVMIYQAVPEGTQSGGWYADVVVATHYAGGDLTLGTPVGKPHPTRQEANEDAICILASILATFPRVTTTAE